MHVLMIVENLPVPFDRRVWNEATALRTAGHDVTVICPTGRDDLPRDEWLEGVHVLRHPLTEAESGASGYLREYAAALWWESRLAWRVWREHRFDVVHLCNPPDLLFLVALPFKVLGARVMFDHHDLNPELYLTKFGRRDLFYAALRMAERLTFATADHVISTNASYARVARDRGRKSADRVTVVRSAPSLDTFRSLPSSDAGVATVGYVGVMADQDGVDLLIHALDRLVRDRGRDDVRAVLVGDGPARGQLERLVGELGLESVVTFTGFLTGDELLRTMASFDVGACPDPLNGYNEFCTMNKVLEYMALGIPVVQFDLDEGRRSAGEASLYAGKANEPGDLAAAIAQLLDDPELRMRLGTVGRQRMASSLEWRHQVPKLLEAYEAIAP